MRPIAFLRDFATKRPKEAAVIFGGTACFAAAAIVIEFGIDYQSAIPIIFYVLMAGALLTIVAAVINNGIIIMILSWFVAILAMSWVIVYIASLAIPENIRIACVAKPWISCEEIADKVAIRYSPKLPPVTSLPTQPIPTAVDPKDYQVYFQFAGFERSRVKTVMTQLAQDGWNVQGVEGGGQRTSAAAGVSQIKYGVDGDFEAANTLAKTIKYSSLNQKHIYAVKVAGIKQGNLEAWVSLP